MADNLPPSSADVTESGSLNLPEPSGPHRPVMGLLYFLPFFTYINLIPNEMSPKLDHFRNVNFVPVFYRILTLITKNIQHPY
jgi:hypothetical protein